MKRQLSVITIMFLCTMTIISSTSNYHVNVAVGNTNTENVEVMLDLNSNQSQYGQDVHKKIENQTSKYAGVSWQKDNRKWVARLVHNKKIYYGGCFDNEEHAAMKVNLLCDKNERKRKNPMININSDVILQVPNQTSKYIGVSWERNKKKWKSQLMHNRKLYFCGHFDNEKQAAMGINLLCDKYEIKRKNPTIDIKPVTKQIPNQTSKYIGVSWDNNKKQWKAQLMHNKKIILWWIF